MLKSAIYTQTIMRMCVLNRLLGEGFFYCLFTYHIYTEIGNKRESKLQTPSSTLIAKRSIDDLDEMNYTLHQNYNHESV